MTNDLIQSKGGETLVKIRSLLHVSMELMFYERYGKRLVDVLVSLFILFLLLPLYPVIAFLLIIFSGRPLIFTQTRSGLLNKTFKIVKFRTMRNVRANFSIKTFEWKEGVPDNFVFKSAQNSKVTKIGVLMRKTSFDELPQLFNVLRGEMSLIGPRPEIPEITKCYSEKQMNRLLVKPGMTGWAQVNGRADSCHGIKIKHDLYYVENLSFQLDMKILFLTIIAIFKGNGAY